MARIVAQTGPDLQHASVRLTDPSVDLADKVAILKEIRDSVDVLQASDSISNVQPMFHIFLELLRDVPVAYETNAPEHILRHLILDIIQRLPMQDALKVSAQELTAALMVVVRDDDEDNAATALKIVVELHKAYKTQLEEHVSPFFSMVQEMYRNMEEAVRDTFDNPGDVDAVPMTKNADGSEEPHYPLARSLYSFKVLKECPIILVLLLQIHRKFVNETVEELVPLIVKALALQPAFQLQAHKEAAAAGDVFVGVSPAIKNRSAYVEFKAMQIKTLSFVAYILKNFMGTLKAHQQAVADSVVMLMKDCPPEAPGIRKELLVATRHLWASDFRTSFVPHIDILLNEKVLVGTGVTSREALRPLAHSFLADLLHHVRMDLTRDQLSRIVYIYSRNLHDFSFAPQIQTMCSKLLLNLIDCITALHAKDDGSREDARGLLMKILDAFANKFTSIHLSLPLIFKYYGKKKTTFKKPDSGPSFVPEPEMFLEYEYMHPIKAYQGPYDQSQDVVKEIRFLFRNLVSGIKTVLYAFRQCNPPPPTVAEQDAHNAFVRGFSETEVQLFLRILRDGLQCFDLYTVDPSLEKNEKGVPPNVNAKEEKEVLESFGAIFAVLEPPIFLEIITSQIGFLLEQMVANPTILGLPHYFLLNAAISPNFIGVLLRFLMDRIELLGSGESQSAVTQAQVMLRLFKLIFMAVTVFPEKNEVVLQPHMSHIIRSSLKLSSKAKEPSNYFLLLRSMFRSIGGGRFELLYKEVLPLLPELLQSLNNLLANAYKPQMRELFVELCLTVPVRLSALLPFLNFLMKPLVLALQSGPELVSQGLRTLELCIDNLTHEFLDPIVSPVIGDLMTALWKHLRPLPYNQTHSHTTMRILGKLGGRNRRILKDSPVLSVRGSIESAMDIGLRLTLSERTGDYSTEQLLQLGDVMDLVTRVMGNQIVAKEKQPHVSYYKEQGFLFLQSCLPLVMDAEAEPQLAAIIKQSAATIESVKGGLQGPVLDPGSPRGITEEAVDMEMDIADSVAASQTSVDELAQTDYPSDERVRYQVPSKARRDAHDRMITQIVVALFNAACVSELEERAWPLILNICRHFLLLHLPECAVQKAGIKPPTKPTISSLEVSSSVFASRIDAFVEGIVDVMTSESTEVRKKGGEALQFIHETCLALLGSRNDLVEQLPVFRAVALRFCSYCFKQEWYRKNGGCHGISMLSSSLRMGTKWMVDHQLEFTKALLYVLKDTSSEMSMSNVDEARRTLSHVLKVCNQQDDNDDVQDRQSKVNNLIHLLVQELPNTNSVVRETIQESLQLLADLTGQEVTDLLLPVRERLLGPIFAKPLRALPVPMQIGHIDAITYCLSLRPPLLQFNDELLRLMHETLAIADAEDQALTQSKSGTQKHPEQIIHLKVVCIKLLSSAMVHAELQAPAQAAARGRIIAVFFKSLYSKASEVVEISYKGLSQVLQYQHKLPKDLLQGGLRPILVNLSDYKKLTVSGLEGLARLLELLTTYFKNEIGRKLLDHLKAWAEPAVLEEATNRPLSEVEEIKIIVAILEAFPLLPQAANIYLADLVNDVMELETKLKRFISSPFRQPLIKYLNRHASDALGYFYDRLGDARHMRLLIDVLHAESAGPFRHELMKNPDKLLSKTFRVTPEENENAEFLHFQGVLIVREIALHHPEWIVQSKGVLDQVLQLWRSERQIPISQRESDRDVERIRETQYILDILVAYSKKQPGDLDVLFEMVQAFTAPSIVDLAFLKKYLWEEVALKLPIASRKAVVHKFLRLFGEQVVQQHELVVALRMLVIPVLLVGLTMPEFSGTLDAELVDEMAQYLWMPYVLEHQSATLDDAMKIELLQITTLIVQFASQMIGDHRRELIKYVWNVRMVEDPTCKQSAYVALARFIEAFETPASIINQALVALLKSHQSESRTLVRQALDVLVPVLPQRLGQTAPVKTAAVTEHEDGSKFPVWVRWTRKVITEDMNNVAQVTSIYQLMIRHADLFYDYRDHFVPLIIPSLPKLGLTTNTTNESRLLTIDLVELVLSWERRRLQDALGIEDVDMAEVSDETSAETGSKRRAPGDFEQPAAKRVQSLPPTDGSEALGPRTVSPAVAALAHAQPSVISVAHREMTLAYCMRFLCTLTEPLSRRTIPYRIATLTRDLLLVWPDISFKLSTVEKVTAQEPTAGINIMVANIFELLHTIIQAKTRDWFVANVAPLQRSLEPVIRTEQPALGKIISRVVRVILSNLPSLEAVTAEAAAAQVAASDAVAAGATDAGVLTTEAAAAEVRKVEVASFVHLVEGVIQGGLQNMTNSSTVVSLLHAAYDNKPEEADKYVTSLCRLLQKLVRDHLSPPAAAPTSATPQSAGAGPAAAAAGQQQTPATAPLEPTGPLVISLLQLLKMRAASMIADNRRVLLKEMINLIERSTDAEVLRSVLSIIREWVFSTKYSFPTVKEKATLVVKMMAFEGRGDRKLSEDYLSLVADIYSHPEFSRTELTLKLEQAFLMGTRNDNPAIRNLFMTLFTNSISRNVSTRLRYVLGVQNWESLSESFWIQQALGLLLGCVSRDWFISQSASSCRVAPSTNAGALLQQGYPSPSLSDDHSAAIDAVVQEHDSFIDSLAKTQVDNLLLPLRELLHVDNEVTHRLWIVIFPLIWNVLEPRERHDMIKLMIALLSKDYHIKQVFARPNVIQTLLEGLARCLPPVALAPQLVKYLSRTYNAWHTGIEILQGMASMDSKNSFVGTKEEDKIRESTMDALADLYTALSEEDYFSGLWRRRCLFNETNLALSYEQSGLWQHAQHFYEAAQNKGRVGVTPFVESEYYLWEEHWMKCTEKLQQWELLSDLAQHEKMHDLLLECAWRLSDWQSTSSDREGLLRTVGELADSPTPRRKVFEAFLLLNSPDTPDKAKAFKEMCDQGMELSLRQWFSLPKIISVSHVPLLHMFQQYVELSEASNIQTNLTSTVAANIETKSQELKSILQTWRERLPNLWEDINMWSDLVAWRQHVFSTINKAYGPLLSSLQQQATGTGGTQSSSYGYRGYHETAWIINRFAHVARKHGLTDVCIASLGKIYSLPNIEIQEAFYKLREQAKCYFQSPSEYPTGLDVINNTNLAYFIPTQKAEFFTLKADFLARLNLHQEANEAYASAVQIEPSTAKAWASWGEYNDRMFAEQPTETKFGIHAINCHLHAAALYKSAKSRKFNARVLWLLSLDDGNGTLYKAFEAYKSEVPLWYWITFIPQLLAALSNKETRHAKMLLKRIAKHFPQALHFHLRAAKEEYSVLRKQVASAAAMKAEAAQAQAQGAQTPGQQTSVKDAGAASEVKAEPSASRSGPIQVGEVGIKAEGENGSGAAGQSAEGGAGGGAGSGDGGAVTGASAVPGSAGGSNAPEGASPSAPPGGQASATPGDAAAQAAQAAQKRQPWESVDEILSALKTAFPLLALSMETMVDQIIQRLKPTADDDMYRLISALLNDAVQNWMSKVVQNENWALPRMMEANLSRLAEGMNHASHIKYKGAFEQDFIKTKPNLLELIARFRDWRDKLEHLLDSRPRRQHLEQYSHYLIEFEHQKFADIEVPGQYLLHKDANVDFITIDRFQPEVDVVRAHGSCLRRLTIRGHDGSLHPFVVQNPATRQGRREERIMQFFRILNTVLERKKESRRRNLSFHLPLIVPLSHQVRLVQDDPSYQSLSEIYEDHCDRNGIYKDEPMIYYTTTLREMLKNLPEEKDPSSRKAKQDLINMRVEIIDHIMNKICPDTVLTRFMLRRMESYEDFWTIRRQFTHQMAAVSFMTWVMGIGPRFPHRFIISAKTGNIWMTEMTPILATGNVTQNGYLPMLVSTEKVPFRFTPNLQTFMTPNGIEGVFTSSLMAMARSLTTPEFDMDDYLSLFIRDELNSWQSGAVASPVLKLLGDAQFRDLVLQNVQLVTKRAEALSCRVEREKAPEINVPVNQTILDLISQATNPTNLAQQDLTWMCWL